MDNDDDDEEDVNNSSPRNEPMLMIGYIKFVFFWQYVFHVSDVGITALFTFIAGFVMMLCHTVKSKALEEFASQLPKTVYVARKILGKDKDLFTKFACCPTCSMTYPLEQLNVSDIVKCEHMKFPNHPQLWRQKPCSSELLKRVKTSAGKTKNKPRQVYSCKSVIDSIKELLCRPDFFTKCEEWRSRQQDPNIMSDVFDGRIWQQFMFVDGVPFLALPFNFAFSLNVDWFQPFKHTKHSIGVLYLAVQNLPRRERFRPENIIIVGVIPGPHEPVKHINSFLNPLVQELQKLWKGIFIETGSSERVLVRAALICVACDIPAARKVCGFVGHSAHLGCSKCMKFFPYDKTIDKLDYSGFDHETWRLRNNATHRENAKKHFEAETLSIQTKVEQDCGCRYSVLLELPYFDPIVMCIIDPMHNLLLGTAKHILSVWKEKGIIKDSQFDMLQARVDSFQTPSDVGRIPSKISSGFSSFTAEQWKNWTLLYSLYSLKEILPHQHYACWKLFVKACFFLCRRSISQSDIEEADACLLDFLKKFEDLYGKEYCTINLHLHAHLTECVKDFGPVYSFWLFSFERMNGILGAFKTNSHDISVQLMRRFLSSRDCCIYQWPPFFRHEFSAVLDKCVYSEGSLSHYSLSSALAMNYADKLVQPLAPVYEKAFDQQTKDEIYSVICTSTSIQDFEILTLYERSNAMKVGKYFLGSRGGRFSTTSVVKVERKLLLDSGIQQKKVGLAEIHHFAKCTLLVKQEDSTFKPCAIWLAAVSFF